MDTEQIIPAYIYTMHAEEVIKNTMVRMIRKFHGPIFYDDAIHLIFIV